jgi:alanine racemase
MLEETPDIKPTAKLRLDGAALVANWQALNKLSGTARAGAAIKADGYGLGARPVVERLLDAGCQDFFVANWQEAHEIEAQTAGKASVSVLNGVREADMAFAIQSPAKPVLNSIEQITRWSETGKECDLMINSGMNRLGVNLADLVTERLHPLSLDMVMSHLASADEDGAQNNDQLEQFREALNVVKGRRISLANSAGIALGENFHFDCTRPGLSLYGGVQRSELVDVIQQVAIPQVEILQTRTLKIGDKVGYNAKYIAERDHDIAILAMGYADGYLRGFSNSGLFLHDDIKLPVLGRVSMDLIAIDISAAPHLNEGDWVDCEYHLPAASEKSRLSQYELITGLGQRLPRLWV